MKTVSSCQRNAELWDGLDHFYYA